MKEEATPNINTPAPEAPAPAAAAPATWHTWMAALAAVLALGAWLVLCFNGYAALGVGLAAFVAGILGLRAHTRPWRNVATTAMIASGVVLVVISAFLVVIFWGLSAI